MRETTALKLIPETGGMEAYLAASETIDYGERAVRELSAALCARGGQEDAAKAAYEFVRDSIRHSLDRRINAATCSASQVLREGHAICFGKSHLLAALLRRIGIPAGFCYQKVYSPSGFYLHGLSAVYLESAGGWARLDARGNREGIDARFSLREEALAFRIDESRGERDYPLILSEPDPLVMAAYKASRTLMELTRALPMEPSGR